MRFLAVPETRRGRWWDPFLRRSHDTATWHAVADISPSSSEALCGLPCTSEPHRTWDVTTPMARCPECQRLVTADGRATAPGRSPRPHTPQQWPQHQVR